MTHELFLRISALTGDANYEGADFNVLRAVKEPFELTATRKASAIADKAFAKLLPYIRPGVTEKELAAKLESFMLLDGSEENPLRQS